MINGSIRDLKILTKHYALKSKTFWDLEIQIAKLYIIETTEGIKEVKLAS